jgi:hypothetical protein
MAENAINEGDARVNVTYDGNNGDLPDPVLFAASDDDVKTWVTEAIRGGGIPGIGAQEADLGDFVVDRFGPTDDRPHNLIQIRPKVPFGS